MSASRTNASPDLDNANSYSTDPFPICHLPLSLWKLVLSPSASRAMPMYTLFPAQQSAYRTFHSTETVVFKLHNDLVHPADDSRLSASAVRSQCSVRYGKPAWSYCVCCLIVSVSAALHSTGSSAISANRLRHSSMPVSSHTVFLLYMQCTTRDRFYRAKHLC